MVYDLKLGKIYKGEYRISMSGPKVDTARLRRQEKERLEAARRRRLSLVSRLEDYIDKIDNCVSKDVMVLKEDKSIVASCDKIQSCKASSLKELNALLDKVKSGNELLEVDEITKESERIYNNFNSSVREELKLINQLILSNEEYKRMEKSRQEMAASKRRIISRISSVKSKQQDISVVNSNNNVTNEIAQDSVDNKEVTEDIVKEQYETFEKEIVTYMEQDSLTVKHKKSILQIRQDLVELFHSDLDIERKSMRISRLFDEYEKMDMMISHEIEDMKLVYNEYRKECFDLDEEPKKLGEFSSKQDIESEIEVAKKVAEKRMTKQYIRRQIDEVMAKHGYNIVKSDILEQANDEGQVLYGVDDNTAIDVFVSNDSQVTMRVVGIGFDSQISDKEEDEMYQQQCAFCSMHPQITAELAMRGVILDTKKHLPADKKYNKKVQTKVDSRNNTMSRAKKELKRSGQKVMHRS